jgi:hypothetical protein
MATKVVTGVCRASYAHVWKPRAIQADQDPKYSVAILIDKKDSETIGKVKAAVKVETDAKYPNGKVPSGFKTPLKDGDTMDREETKGHWVLNASSEDKPGIVDAQRNDIIDPAQIYSGCYCRFQVTFAHYDWQQINKGIGCYLNHIQKIKDGPSLSGREDAASAFDDGKDLPADEDALS